jgi:hypothetical protein
MQPGHASVRDDIGLICPPDIQHANTAFGQLFRLRDGRHFLPGIFPAFAKRWGLISARATIPDREGNPYIAGITSPNVLNKGLPETPENRRRV